jgi:hypothetical protein
LSWLAFDSFSTFVRQQLRRRNPENSSMKLGSYMNGSFRLAASGSTMTFLPPETKSSQRNFSSNRCKRFRLDIANQNNIDPLVGRAALLRRLIGLTSRSALPNWCVCQC